VINGSKLPQGRRWTPIMTNFPFQRMVRERPEGAQGMWTPPPAQKEERVERAEGEMKGGDRRKVLPSCAKRRLEGTISKNDAGGVSRREKQRKLWPLSQEIKVRGLSALLWQVKEEKNRSDVRDWRLKPPSFGRYFPGPIWGRKKNYTRQTAEKGLVPVSYPIGEKTCDCFV